MNNPINEAFLNDTIKTFRQEQSAISNKQDFGLTDEDKDLDNKMMKLCCTAIENLLRIKALRTKPEEKEPKEGKPKKEASKRGEVHAFKLNV
jgi:hypothetical protein